ncbi:DUF2510 domain-containing protein [Microbacterium sp. HJ5]
MQPPGWLYDEETGRTRWWDGVRWTDLVKPLDPVVRTAAAYTPVAAPAPATVHAAPSSGNGAAAAGLLLTVLGALGLAAGVWLVGGIDQTTVSVLTTATGLLVAAGFACAVAGLVIAIRRPTKKAAAITGIVLSTIVGSVFVFRVLFAVVP